METEYGPLIEQAAEEVFSFMAPRVDEEDLQRIRNAYMLASEAHKEQKRKSGEPYIIHPISVARIVARELELEANSVIAAFLHDVVEDTPYTIEDIRERFGDDVAFLVDVVTKKKKEVYESSKQIDNFKQILDSVNYDIRALLVKLADRLHNMRTLDSMRPDKQMKIAGETDFFYAPLANRLGLYNVKSDLENLSFRYRCPREFLTIDSQLQADRERTSAAVKAFTDEIQSILSAKGIQSRIEVRYRKPYSIWRNMISDSCDFSHVECKHYIRVIYVPGPEWTEKDTSLFIYSLLTSRFKERPGSVSNYIDNPKQNGYQSFHVKLLNPLGIWEELHISSERMIRNARLGCIVERDEGNVSGWLDRFKEVLQDMAYHNSEQDFMEGVSSTFYNEDIVAFTPKGRGVILPKGATALDFAYEIHTRVGEHAQYARINGRLCSIKTELHRGDCVEIGLSDSIKPQPGWMEAATTYKARKAIRSFLRRQPHIKYSRCPLCNPLPGDEVIGFKDEKGAINLHTRHCAEAIRLASEDGDAIVAVNFEENPDFLYPVRIHAIAIDRYHLMRDIIDCITEELHLSMGNLVTEMKDQIVDTTIDFYVHSSDEFETALNNISHIDGVEEVQEVHCA